MQFHQYGKNKEIDYKIAKREKDDRAAREHEAKKNKAERDAIKAAWKDRDPRIWDICFRPKWNKQPSPPTSEEFIVRIVEGLKHQMRFEIPAQKEKII